MLILTILPLQPMAVMEAMVVAGMMTVVAAVAVVY